MTFWVVKKLEIAWNGNLEVVATNEKRTNFGLALTMMDHEAPGDHAASVFKENQTSRKETSGITWIILLFINQILLVSFFFFEKKKSQNRARVM